MTVRRSAALAAGGVAAGGEGGARETVGAAGREPIRRDEERVERAAFERLKAELQHAFAAPEECYRPLTVAEVIARSGEKGRFLLLPYKKAEPPATNRGLRPHVRAQPSRE